MGRAPCCDKANVKKGPWSPEEDVKLKEYMEKNGTGGNWIALPQKAGLRRCGKSCRLRWLNYLRPNIKHGDFSDEEDRIICSLYANIGSRWSIIAAQLPGRTDNDIKNYWNTKLKKKLIGTVTPNSSYRRLQHHQHMNHNTTIVMNSPPSYSYLSPLQTLSPSSAVYNYNSSNSSTISNNYYNNTTSAYESISSSIPSTITMNNTCSSSASTATVLQTPDQSYGASTSNDYYQTNDGLFMFGREVSCSTSDGSYNNNNRNQVNANHGNKIEQIGLEGYLYSGVDEGDNHKYIVASHGVEWFSFSSDMGNALCVEGSLDCGSSSIEEIKQLISSDFSDNLNLCVDESKTQALQVKSGKCMYF